MVTVYVPALRLSMFCVVLPLLHKKVYGLVPPLTNRFTEPLVPPKQETFGEAVVMADRAAPGWLTPAVMLLEQPLASVMIIV